MRKNKKSAYPTHAVGKAHPVEMLGETNSSHPYSILIETEVLPITTSYVDAGSLSEDKSPKALVIFTKMCNE